VLVVIAGAQCAAYPWRRVVLAWSFGRYDAEARAAQLTRFSLG